MWKQIDFRDYLNANLDWAKEYETLKIKLATKFKNDRSSYVLGKTDFINDTLKVIEDTSRAV